MQVSVKDLVVTNLGFAVLLKADGDPRTLPIFIGPPEAQSISIQLSGAVVPRPLTHDLLKQAIANLGGELVRSSVCAVRQGTFFGELLIRQSDRLIRLDVRPSDAIALALRCGAPIFVAREVMEKAGRVMDQASGAPAGDGGGKPAAAKTSSSPVERLNKEMKKAVNEERYEDAARLRDRIKHLDSHSRGN